jgi:hypothetical protein
MADKQLTVAEDMKARVVFDSTESAVAYLTKCATDFSDFGKYPVAAPGLDAEGNFDTTVYADGMIPMVALLKNNRAIKAIVITPIPTLDSLMSDQAGIDWVTRIIRKELNHVAVRALREAEDISTVIDQMPTTRDGYINSAREGASGIMEAFNDLYKAINATMAKVSPAWLKRRLLKADLRKAMESKGFALDNYPELEDRGTDKESLFEVALRLGKSAAEKQGLDPTIFARWSETRATKAYDPAAVDEEEDIDFDSLSEQLLAEVTADNTPAPASAADEPTGTTE